MLSSSLNVGVQSSQHGHLGQISFFPTNLDQFITESLVLPNTSCRPLSHQPCQTIIWHAKNKLSSPAASGCCRKTARQACCKWAKCASLSESCSHDEISECPVAWESHISSCSLPGYELTEGISRKKILSMPDWWWLINPCSIANAKGIRSC